MGLKRPELPIRHRYRSWKGPPWRRQYYWEETVYEDWASFFHDVEQLDTFGDPNQWLEDSSGSKWDVRTHEYLWGDESKTIFEPRPSTGEWDK